MMTIKNLSRMPHYIIYYYTLITIGSEARFHFSLDFVVAQNFCQIFFKEITGNKMKIT